MWPNPQFPADLVIFTEEILNIKFHFCAVSLVSLAQYLQPIDEGPFFQRILQRIYGRWLLEQCQREMYYVVNSKKLNREMQSMNNKHN